MTHALSAAVDEDGCIQIDARLDCGNEGALDPLKLLSSLLGRDVKLGDRVQAERAALWADRGGELVSVFEVDCGVGH
jgi:hypothetical protein